MNFYKNFSTFQKIFFLFFTIASILIFLLPIFISNGNISNVISPLGVTGIICTISGILVSIYTAKANISAYIWWIINTITLAIIALVSNLYGQFIENLFIVLPLIIYGFVAWKRNLSTIGTKRISINKFTKNQWLLATLATLGCFIIYTVFLNKLPMILCNLFHIEVGVDPQTILDSITATLTIMAVILTAKRYVEQWNFWLISNILGFIMFLIQTIHTGISNPAIFVGDLSNTLSILQYGVGSVYGYILWKKMYKKPKVDLPLATQ